MPADWEICSAIKELAGNRWLLEPVEIPDDSVPAAHYGQSAIFTPSDFPFLLQTAAGEADPNVETLVINDLNLTSLAQYWETGDVRPFHDRRPDLYDLQAKQKIKIIRIE